MHVVRMMAPLLVLLASVGEGRSADLPLDGGQLTIQRSPKGAGAVTVVLENAAVPVAIPGSADDPSLTGVTLTVFGRTSGTSATFVAAAASAAGTWKIRPGTKTTFSYVDRDARTAAGRLGTVQLRTGSGVKLKAPHPGLALDGAEQAVAVRVEWGAQRVCALFDADDVRVAKVGRFMARGADAALLPDCSDETMTGAPTAGCGITSPSCGGVCPSGHVCTSVGPADRPVCQCEEQTGGCPEGCPDGWICAYGGPCLPPFCEGGGAACDGTCSQPGTECLSGGTGFCFCLTRCAGGDPWPGCGGACPDPRMTCVAAPSGDCICG